MGKVNVIVTSETTEIGHDSLSSGDFVVVEGPTLPLGKRKGNFQLDVLEVARRKGGWTFDAIQVVVESRPLGQKHGARHTLEVDVLLEVVFKGRLDKEQGFFLFQQVVNGRLVASVDNVLGRESGERVLRIEGGSHGAESRR